MAFSQHTWTAEFMTMLGFSVDLPAACRASFHLSKQTNGQRTERWRSTVSERMYCWLSSQTQSSNRSRVGLDEDETDFFFMANVARMIASDDPTVETPRASSSGLSRGALKSRAIILTERLCRSMVEGLFEIKWKEVR